MDYLVQFILQLGLLIVLTRIGGFWLRRWLHVPSVLGELLVGVIVGPYALGRFAWPVFGHVFSMLQGEVFTQTPLYALATLASIVLLFLSGLETDLSTFLRYSVAGTLVGLGGVIVAYLLGAGAAVWWGFATGWMDPEAMFLGAIATATSIGISARILSEKRKMDSPEGVTILAAAVFDDVLGIIVLAIVVGMAQMSGGDGGGIHWADILKIAGKAFGFWLGATILGLLLARRFSRILKYFKTTEAIAALAFGCALLLAGISEMVGLAMIIGAYIMGLSLSRTDLVQVIHHELDGLNNILVPIFFATMGMMVDVTQLASPKLLQFGLVYAGLAILSKVAGCAFPALLCGFNRHGALRIGMGMIPRGEVALIAAGIGIAKGAIGQDIFSVAILMTLVTTFLGPLLLSGSFENKLSGVRKTESALDVAMSKIELVYASRDVADFMRMRLVQAFRREEFYVYRLAPDTDTYHIRKDDMLFTLECVDLTVTITCHAKYEALARMVMVEEMIVLGEVLDMARGGEDLAAIQNKLLASLFSSPTDAAAAVPPDQNVEA